MKATSLRAIVADGQASVGTLSAPIIDLMERRRWFAVMLSVFAGLILGVALAVHVLTFGDVGQRLGIDFRQYVDATSRWMAGGSFYQPWQLTGPYALVLFAPFTRSSLLAPLWWGIPLVVTVSIIRAFRPRPWTWPVLTLCVLSPDTTWLSISGNPVIWATAAVALGTRYHWPFVGALIKPSLAPIALLGVLHRSWWIALAALAFLGLLFLPMWRDYIAALNNQRGGGLLYSWNNLPIMSIPLVAWLGRSPRLDE